MPTSAQQAEKDGIAAAPWLECDRKAVLDPGPLYEDAIRNGTSVDWYGKANSIEIANGYKPGSATLLMTRRDAEKLPKDELITITWHDGDKKIEFHGWVVVRYYSILPVLEDDKDAPVVVELEDVRALASRAFVDSFVWTGKTWKEIAESIESAWRDAFYRKNKLIEGAKEYAKDVEYPEFPDQVPQVCEFDGAPAWRSWCAVLRQLTLDVVADPFEQKFRVFDAGKTSTSEKRREPIIYDYGDGEGSITRPSKITVAFSSIGQQSDGEGGLVAGDDPPTVFGGAWYAYWFGWGSLWNDWYDFWFGGTKRSTRTVTLDETDLPELKGGLGAATVWDSTAIDYTTENYSITVSLEETEATLDRAKDLAKRWLKRNAGDVHRTQKHYMGVLKVTPGAEITVVRWRDYGDGSGTITELHYGEQPDPDRPYLIEAGIVGRGIWQLNPTPDYPKLHVDFDRQPRVSVCPIDEDFLEFNQVITFNSQADPPFGSDTGGAGQPAVIYENSDADSQGVKLRVQENGSYRIHLHGLLGVSSSEPGIAGIDNGYKLRLVVRVNRVSDEQDEQQEGEETDTKEVLVLTRKHFQWESDGAYSPVGFVSAENVAGETVVPLRAGEWLEIVNTSEGMPTVKPAVEFRDAILVVSREDVTQ